MRRVLVAALVVVASQVARADYWMTFGKTPDGRVCAQIGYVRPDGDGFVTIKAGTQTVVVYKAQVWYVKMPGEPPSR